MKISLTETDELPPTHLMVWFGHIFPFGHLVSWLCVNKTNIELTDHVYSQEDFDKIPQEGYIDTANLKNIRSECFPCRSYLVTIPASNGNCKIAGLVPDSELKRVGFEL